MQLRQMGGGSAAGGTRWMADTSRPQKTSGEEVREACEKGTFIVDSEPDRLSAAGGFMTESLQETAGCASSSARAGPDQFNGREHGGRELRPVRALRADRPSNHCPLDEVRCQQ
jgi:hypothetical protein